MRIVIEFEEIVTRQVTVNCTDLQVARELFESGPFHIIDNWRAESVRTGSGIDRDSGSFWPLGEPPEWVLPDTIQRGEE